MLHVYQLFKYIIYPIEQKLYWMNYDGDLKSIYVDGSDIVKTIVWIRLLC